MHNAICAVSLMLLLVGCKDPSSPTKSQQKELPQQAADVSTVQPEGIRGSVLGNDFIADQIILRENEIAFRQGKEFFADREMTMSVFPDELPLNQAGGVVRTASIKFSYLPEGESLPKSVNANNYTLLLHIGTPNELGAPIEVQLDVTGAQPSRIHGRGFATFKDIRVFDSAVDLQWDSFDTIRYVAQKYLQRTRQNQRLGFDNEFGLLISKPGVGKGPNTAFLGYELAAEGESMRLVKLQLMKTEIGWRVENELPIDQIQTAHPLDTGVDGKPARLSPETIASLALEARLQAKKLIGDVRATYASCTTSAERGDGSCETRYDLKSTFGAQCYGQNYRMRSDDGVWRVVEAIGLNERVDWRTGKLVEYKPSTFGCSGSDIKASL